MRTFTASTATAGRLFPFLAGAALDGEGEDDGDGPQGDACDHTVVSVRSVRESVNA